MPETCLESIDNNHLTVASCWFSLSLFTISVLFLLFCRIVSERTVRSVSQSDGVSDGVGSRQTLPFRLFERPRTAFDASRWILDLVTCSIFFF